MLDIETLILEYLIFNTDYFEVVMPHLEYQIFESTPHKYIARIIQWYYKENGENIPYDILGVKIQNLQNVNAETVNSIKKVYNTIQKPTNTNIEAVIRETEKYIKQRKIWNVISDGIEQYDKSKSFSVDFLDSAEKAITFSFDETAGYDYFANALERFKSYRENVDKIPTSIDKLNEMTGGGVEKQTLNACISSTNGGKSVWLCQEAAYNVLQGRNVLYITLEMRAEAISKRIDANILNTEQDKLGELSDEAVKFRFKQITEKSCGKIFVHSLPADATTVLDIKNMMEKIKRVHNVNIDVLMVDYLGLLNSYRYSAKVNNSYTIGKHTTEELRNLAVQYNIPIWTAIQFNRGAENPEDINDIGLKQTSDSYGIPMGLDFLFAIIHTTELDLQKRSVFKILKTRYSNHKGSTGMFTVKQNYPLARFENDPDQVDFTIKNDNNSNVGKQIDKKLKEKKETNIVPEDTNTVKVTNDDLFLE